MFSKGMYVFNNTIPGLKVVSSPAVLNGRNDTERNTCTANNVETSPER
jgi:hypothetical protein